MTLRKYLEIAIPILAAGTLFGVIKGMSFVEWFASIVVLALMSVGFLAARQLASNDKEKSGDSDNADGSDKR